MRFLRMKQVAELVGYHPVHIRRLAKAGKFPKPVPLGERAVGFVEDEVIAWQEDRIAKRDAATAG